MFSAWVEITNALAYSFVASLLGTGIWRNPRAGWLAGQCLGAVSRFYGMVLFPSPALLNQAVDLESGALRVHWCFPQLETGTAASELPIDFHARWPSALAAAHQEQFTLF